MIMNSVLQQHLESGQYLPPEFRDFHDQKDIFKAIGNRDVSVHESIKEIINFRQGMIYTIDHFLWFMAIHGYELKKVKNKKIPRCDLQETIEENQKKQLESMRSIFEDKKD